VSGVHLFEGTHSFKFWIYRDLPERNPANDFEKTQFAIRDLRQGLDEKVVDEGLEAGLGVVHHPVLRWQHQIITRMAKLGVRIEPRTVLTNEDYLSYRKKYGIS